MALDILSLFRKLDNLLQLDAKHGAAISRIEADLEELKARVARLEIREEVLIAEAKSASSSAASAATTSVVADLSRRIGVLEERSRLRLALPGNPDSA